MKPTLGYIFVSLYSFLFFVFKILFWWYIIHGTRVSFCSYIAKRENRKKLVVANDKGKIFIFYLFNFINFINYFFYIIFIYIFFFVAVEHTKWLGATWSMVERKVKAKVLLNYKNKIKINIEFWIADIVICHRMENCLFTIASSQIAKLM